MAEMWPIIVLGLGLVILTLGITLGPLYKTWWRGLIIASSLVLALWSAWQSPWLAVVGTTLTFSSLRLIKHRYGSERERRVLGRTTSWLALGVVLIAVWQLVPDTESWLGWDVLSAVLLLGLGARALALALSRSWQYQFRLSTPASREIKPLTLAVPARNETHALTDHLRAAAASSYAKLEVLVLDDCSQDSTPEIVRSFAHDGVRFIQGRAPASSWLGKNFAYQALLDEASGDWVLFAGVDIRFARDSIIQLVQFAEQTGADLVSVMPYRRNFDVKPWLARPLRYFWQLGVSGWPMMNSCWLVKRDWLLKQKGFGPFKHSVAPERDLAKLARSSDSYRFVVSTPQLGITTRKRAGSLFETAKRTLYPLMRREAAWLALKSVILVSWLVLPWLPETKPVTALLLVFGWSFLWLAYFISEMLLQPRHWFVSGWSLPINLVNEVWLGLVSAWGYEYGQVNWKGRNICLPVLAQDSRSR